MARTTTIIAIRVGQDVAARIPAAAQATGRTRNGYLVGLIEAAVGRGKPEERP